MENQEPTRAQRQPSARGHETGGLDLASARVHETADRVRGAAEEHVDSMREAADSAKHKAALKMRQLGQTCHKLGDQLREDNQGYVADQADDASRRLESMANYLDEAPISRVLEDAQDVTRRYSGWVLGGAFVLGLASSRLLKKPVRGAAQERNAKRTLAAEDRPEWGGSETETDDVFCDLTWEGNP